MTEKCERCGSLMYQPLLGPRAYVCKLCERHAIEWALELRAVTKKPSCQCLEHIKTKYQGVGTVKYHERLEVADITICSMGAHISQQAHGYLKQNYCPECGAPLVEGINP